MKKFERNGRRIVIAKNVPIMDMDGVTRTCTLEVDTFVIADVYVKYSGNNTNKRNWHLSDDNKFVNNVMKYLNKMGYNGGNFGRAEMGMQDNNLAVLEPNDSFEEFAQKKFGFTLQP